MEHTEYSVSEAAKLLKVKTHVLRYWEEEMQLPIHRNELGHRYYTFRDIQIFYRILEMKRDGMALKEIGKVVSTLYIEETDNKIEARAAEIPEQFWGILDKLIRIKQGAQEGPEETYYQKLDMVIRSRQQKQKLAAATVEQKTKKKSRFGSGFK